MIRPTHPSSTSTAPRRSWRTSSIALLFGVWAILQLGGLFTPGLLDDVDSVYIQVAREMLQRHDYITPTIDGIRFFDKPPLMYWMAAASMRIFGVHDWAARLPLALGVLALIFAVYALGIRFYSRIQPSPSAQDSAQNPGADPDPGAGAPHLASEMWVPTISPQSTFPNDRAGLYAALAIATALGPYLYTRFYIPDVLIALWMTLAVHLFLIALERTHTRTPETPTLPSFPLTTPETPVILSEAQSAQPNDPDALRRSRTARPLLTTNSPLLPMLGFAAVTALSLLTKGLIGVVFPIGFALLYLAFTHQLKLLAKLRLIPSTLVFLTIAAPWHILAALRNPPIAMPRGVGLPSHAGWAWFYLYNEHIARFLGRRIPHDYGQVPIPIFWLLLLLWLFPWVAFLPAALLDALRILRHAPADTTLRFDSDANFSHAQLDSSPTQSPIPSTGAKPGPPKGVLGPLGWDRSGEPPVFHSPHPDSVSLSAARSAQSKDPETLRSATTARALSTPTPPRLSTLHEIQRSPSAQDSAHQAALACLLWAGIILGFFTLSSRQEYYHLPALPALALLVGGLLAAADAELQTLTHQTTAVHSALRAALRGSLLFLAPVGAFLLVLCGYFALTSPAPHPGTTLNDVLSSNPALYNLSLGHVFDLTGHAMGFFKGPLLTVALCMLALGPISHLIRRSASATRPNRALLANLLVTAAMTGVLLAAHEGLVRFYPILGSKPLALAIDTTLKPGDRIAIDGELTSGSTLLFYTPQSAAPILLVNGRVNGPWFGSFWPDAPHIFPNDAQLHALWAGPHRVFLLTYDPAKRSADLSRFAPVYTYANSGGKTILSNRTSPKNTSPEAQ